MVGAACVIVTIAIAACVANYWEELREAWYLYRISSEDEVIRVDAARALLKRVSGPGVVELITRMRDTDKPYCECKAVIASMGKNALPILLVSIKPEDEESFKVRVLDTIYRIYVPATPRFDLSIISLEEGHDVLQRVIDDPGVDESVRVLATRVRAWIIPE